MPDKKGGEAGGSGGGTGGGSGGVGGTKSLMGQMENYILGEDFKMYLDRFNNFLELNNVEVDAFKIQLLTHFVGPTASAKIMKTCLPKKPKEFSFQQLVAKCESIFCGERNSIADHYKFNVRCQKLGEAISDFALELQSLAERCDFKEFLDTALRDRFVVGLCDSEIKSRLLSEAKNDNFEKVVQMAMSMEMVARSVEVMERSSEGIHGVRRSVFKTGRLGKRERSRSRESSESREQRRRAQRRD
jgi:hypothetical protein